LSCAHPIWYCNKHQRYASCNGARCVLRAGDEGVRKVVCARRPSHRQVPKTQRPRSQNKSRLQFETVGQREVAGQTDRQTVRSRRILHRVLPADETRVLQDAQNAQGEGVETGDQPEESNRSCAEIGEVIVTFLALRKFPRFRVHHNTMYTSF